MRLLLIFLVLCNLIVLVIGVLSLSPTSNPDSGRQWQEIHPERLRKVGEARAGAAPLPAVLPTPRASLPTETGTKEASTASTACALWSGLTRRDEERVVGQLAKLTQLTVKRQPAPKWTTWLVYLPVLTTIDLTQSELANKGVRDGTAGKNESTGSEIISLGFYSTEGAAEARLRELARLGVKGARIGPRQKGGGFAVEMRAPLADIIKATNAVQKVLPELEVSACP